MKFQLFDGALAQYRSDCLVVGVGVTENGEPQLSEAALALDAISGGYLSALAAKGDLPSEVGQGVRLHHLPNAACERLIVVGTGKAAVQPRQFEQIVQKAWQLAEETGAETLSFALNEAAAALNQAQPFADLRLAVASICESRYQYQTFKSEKNPKTDRLQAVEFQLVGERSQAELALAQAQAVALGVKFAKEVANCPPNVCTPKYLADQALALAENYDHLTASIIDEAQMAALGMGAYLAVSRGSANPAYLSVLEYRNNPNPNAKPIVLVGKGMTFDAGGLSLKPAEAMDEMKYDMGGAAAVYGTMKAVAELQLPLNVVGLLVGCENMPDGNAYRPGDILTTMSGKTVEVLNTDAEGRLVLCDALTYAERFEPEAVIDVATLTGACMVALGQHNSGLFTADESLASQLLAAASQSGDKAWRLPLDDDYQAQLKSNFADLANIGSRYGGAINAAVFLSNFTQKYPWAHLDVAGTAWKSGAAKGATGRPVPLLSQFLINRAQS